MGPEENVVKIGEHLRSQYKDQKWLLLAFEHELNPKKLQNLEDYGNILTSKKLNSPDEFYS